MPLTDAQCRNATCPSGKRQARFSDAQGMYLQVSAQGSKRWFWKYRVGGKEKQFALGSYPAVSLAAARKARDEARVQKAGGQDPVQLRRSKKLQNLPATVGTFREVALAWFEKNKASWSNHYAIREKRNLEKDLFPRLGDTPFPLVQRTQLLAAIQQVEERGALDVAHRVLKTARAVGKYAIAIGVSESDITRDLSGALTPHHGKHFAAIVDPEDFGTLIRVIRGYQGGPIVRAALQLAPILFQRPGELRAATWNEFDLEAGMWTIPAARMKRRKQGKENGPPHLVPLPRQAITLLRELHPHTGKGTLVFPGERSRQRPISDNTLGAALKTLGYGSTVQTVHGFRASARTMLDEKLGVDPLVIEAQLAHTVKDPNGRAYNRVQYIQQRAEMMQRWADYLDQLAAPPKVIQLQAAQRA